METRYRWKSDGETAFHDTLRGKAKKDALAFKGSLGLEAEVLEEALCEGGEAGAEGKVKPLAL